MIIQLSNRIHFHMQRLKLYIQIIKCAMYVIGKQENASIGRTLHVYVNKIIRVNTYYKQN